MGKKHGIAYWLFFGWLWELVALWFKFLGYAIKGLVWLISCFFKAITDRTKKKSQIKSISISPAETISLRDQQVLENQKQKPIRNLPYKQIMNICDYIVLDLETTGLESYDRITEISAIKFQNNIEIDRFHTLINPETEITQRITDITGITNFDVRNAPVFSDIAEQFDSFLGNFPIVAHNVHFDAGFLIRSFTAAGCPKTFDCIDTVDLAKLAFCGLKRYKLDSLCTELHITNQKQSHRAEDDAERVAKLFDLCRDALRNGWTVDDIHRKHRAYLDSLVIHPKDFKPKGPIDPESPLYKKTVAFTGDFSVKRKQLAQQAVNAGAILRVSVTPTLDYLVIGAPNTAVIGPDGVSRKEKEARALIESGNAKLRILSEIEFEQTLAPKSDT